jgi:hypothetical protein
MDNVVIEIFRKGAWHVLCTLDDVCAAEEQVEQLSQSGHQYRARFGQIHYTPGRGWEMVQSAHTSAAPEDTK